MCTRSKVCQWSTYGGKYFRSSAVKALDVDSGMARDGCCTPPVTLVPRSLSACVVVERG